MTLNDLKEYTVEISFTRTKLLIIISRRNHHYKCEFPIVQGKKIIATLGGSKRALAEKLRLSSTKTLYVENLQRILYPKGHYTPENLKLVNDNTPNQKKVKYLDKIQGK